MTFLHDSLPASDPDRYVDDTSCHMRYEAVVEIHHHLGGFLCY